MLRGTPCLTPVSHDNDLCNVHAFKAFEKQDTSDALALTGKRERVESKEMKEAREVRSEAKRRPSGGHEITFRARSARHLTPTIVA